MSTVDINIKWKGPDGVYLFGRRGVGEAENELYANLTIVKGHIVKFRTINCPKFEKESIDQHNLMHATMTAFILRGEKVEGYEGSTKYLITLESTAIDMSG